MNKTVLYVLAGGAAVYLLIRTQQADAVARARKAPGPSAGTDAGGAALPWYDSPLFAQLGNIGTKLLGGLLENSPPDQPAGQMSTTPNTAGQGGGDNAGDQAGVGENSDYGLSLGDYQLSNPY